MLKKILNFGVIAGLIVGGVLFGTTVGFQGNHPPLWIGALIGYSSMLIALSTIFIAIKRHRDQDLGGVIKFFPALGIGLGISVIAGIFYVLAWEAALKVTGIDFAEGYYNELIKEKQAAGAPDAEIEKLRTDAVKFQTQYANPAYRVPMTFVEIFPVGVLVSLVSAGLLRNRRFLPAR